VASPVTNRYTVTSLAPLGFWPIGNRNTAQPCYRWDLLKTKCSRGLLRCYGSIRLLLQSRNSSGGVPRQLPITGSLLDRWPAAGGNATARFVDTDKLDGAIAEAASDATSVADNRTGTQCRPGAGGKPSTTRPRRIAAAGQQRTD
jgi:hypothetical protein